MGYFAFFFHTTCSKSGVYLTLTTHFRLDLSIAQSYMWFMALANGQHSWDSPQTHPCSPDNLPQVWLSDGEIARCIGLHPIPEMQAQRST